MISLPYGRDSNPCLDETHEFVPRVLCQLSYWVTLNGIGVLYLKTELHRFAESTTVEFRQLTSRVRFFNEFTSVLLCSPFD